MRDKGGDGRTILRETRRKTSWETSDASGKTFHRQKLERKTRPREGAHNDTHATKGNKMGNNGGKASGKANTQQMETGETS